MFNDKNTDSIGWEPNYIALSEKGELKKRGKMLWEMLEHCELCPRACGSNRLKGELGVCKATAGLKVSSFHPHFGEEEPLVGTGGSGTIFLSYCGLQCVFCFNWEISHAGEGFDKSIDELADMMLTLQRRGSQNINFVTPTQYSPHIVLALDKAVKKGLKLPIVYNTSGYERLEILKRLNGIVDIYLADFKYSDSAIAKKYSPGAADYPDVARKALLEMHRQVGVAKPEPDGLIRHGLMIRHLVMPNNSDNTKKIIDWIAENLPKDTYLNLMAQYVPSFRAYKYPEISKRLKPEEYYEAVRYAIDKGLTNLDVQPI